MEQNAFHLVYLLAAILGTTLLPITIGLIAVLREGATAAAAEASESVPTGEGLERGY